MGFFGIAEQRINANQPPLELLHKQGCKLCTLDKEAKRLISPKMPPSGADKPLVYCLGEGPGEIEDQQGKQFVGASGKLLREHIPRAFIEYIRWNNVVNCRPENNRDPTTIEIECCSSRLIPDIEQSKPEAIFGLGGIPLGWSGKSNIFNWRGKKFPIKIGKHTCWYFAFHHPAYLLHMRSQNNGRPSNYELAFKFDMSRAFNTIANGLPEPVIHTEEFARKNIVQYTGKQRSDLDNVLEFLDIASKETVAGLDYETQGLRPYATDALILSAAVSIPYRTMAFAMDHPEAGWSDKDRKELKKGWRKFLLSKVRKAVHSLHFEMEWSAYFFGKDVLRATRWEDTLTQAYILDERKDALSLEFLTQQYFGINIKKLTGTLPKDNMKSVPLSKLLPYNAIDAKYHLYLYEAQLAALTQESLQAPYEEKLRQVPTCVLTQMKGMPVDFHTNQEFDEKYTTRIKEAEFALMSLPEIKDFKRRTGEEFNPGSEKDVSLLLRDFIGVTAKNTDKSVLDKLEHPFGKLELTWRNFSKMKSTYIDPCSPNQAYPDGLLHPNFTTCFTDTGRLSSNQPNSQNFPRRDEEQKEVRRQISAISKAFGLIPARNGIFASLDYGQIEARLIAAASRDKRYCKATWDGYDVHGHWARRIAKRYPKSLDAWRLLSEKDQLAKLRDKVKNKFVFPAFFTAVLKSLSTYMDIPEENLRPEYEQFWKDFEGIKTWQDKVRDKFMELGYTECLNGRRRRAPLGLGQIINSAIQGSATDIAMDGMNRLSELDIPELQPIIMLHDDLTFFFESEKDMEDCIEIIVKEMLNVRFPWLCVPLTVELAVGKNWADMEKIDTFSSDKLLGWPIREPEFI